MTPIIPEPPRPAVKLPEPRPLPELIEAARLVPCGQCWAYPAAPCDGTSGYHLARFCRAYRRGLITEPELRLVVLPAAGDVFTPATILTGGAA